MGLTFCNFLSRERACAEGKDWHQWQLCFLSHLLGGGTAVRPRALSDAHGPRCHAMTLTTVAHVVALYRYREYSSCTSVLTTMKTLSLRLTSGQNRVFVAAQDAGC